MLSMYMLVSGEWNMPFLFCLVITACLYGGLLFKFTAIKFYHRQPLFFLLGLALVYITMGSPLSTVSHLSFSFHMFFMSIHYFIIPPLLLQGLPYPILQKLRKIPYIERLSILPIVALYVFGLLFFAYHLQMVLDIFSQYPLVHTSYMLILFLLSFLMWWPTLSPQYDDKKTYVKKSVLFIMPACFFFIVAGILGGMGGLPVHTELNATLCLPSKLTPADLLPFPFNSGLDQIAAGILMIGMHKFGITIAMRNQKGFRSNA